MWMSKWVYPALLAGAAMWLSGCDERCSERNCRSMMKECGFALTTEPNYSLCGSTPSIETRTEDYCPQACAASGAGKALECFWDNDVDCDEGDAARRAVGARCALSSGDSSCMMKCGTERTTCEQKCSPDAGTKLCMDCAKRCGWAQGRCETACREKS
jgi:hypothetical protein